MDGVQQSFREQIIEHLVISTVEKSCGDAHHVDARNFSDVLSLQTGMRVEGVGIVLITDDWSELLKSDELNPWTRGELAGQLLSSEIRMTASE